MVEKEVVGRLKSRLILYNKYDIFKKKILLKREVITVLGTIIMLFIFSCSTEPQQKKKEISKPKVKIDVPCI